MAVSIPAVLGGLGSLIGAGASIFASGDQDRIARKQLELDRKNFDLQREAYDWQKSRQDIAWQREDNAVQRRVADLKAAGLSPVLAAGSSAQASGPISVRAPQHSSSALDRQQTKNEKMLQAFDRLTGMAGNIMGIMQQRKNLDITDANLKLIKNQIEESHHRSDKIIREAGLALWRTHREHQAWEMGEHDFNISKEFGTRTDVKSGFIPQLQMIESFLRKSIAELKNQSD